MPSMKAEAKNPSMVELKAGKIYKSYDITGDKKKDTVKISIPKDQYDRYGTVKITVNKKTTKITRTWTSYAIHTRLITLKNGKAYLWIQGETDNEDDPWESIKKEDLQKSLISQRHLTIIRTIIIRIS